MPLLSCHEPGTTEKYGASSFLLLDLRCRFSTAERREAAVASGADRFLFFLAENTTKIWFGMNFNGLCQFRTRKLACCVHNILYENNLHCHPLLTLVPVWCLLLITHTSMHLR